MPAIVKNNYSVFAILLLLFLSLGLTTQMFFWRDDFMMLYKLEHIDQNVGSLGSGFIGQKPYKYLITPYYLVYPLFGQTAYLYFVFGMCLFSLAALFFYWMVKMISDRKVAVLATILFVSLNIETEGYYRIINSWQNIFVLFFSIGVFGFLILYFQKKKTTYYFLSLAFFVVAQEVVYVRAQNNILGVFAIIAVFAFVKPKLRKFFKSAVLLIPYLSAFAVWYLLDPFRSANESGMVSRLSFINVGTVMQVFANLGNVIFPSYYQNKLLVFISTLTNAEYARYAVVGIFISAVFFLTSYLILRSYKCQKIYLGILLFFIVAVFLVNYFVVINLNIFGYNSIGAFTSGFVGLLFVTVFVITAVALKRTNIKHKVLLVISFLLIISQYIGYIYFFPATIFNTTHRYLISTLIGYSLFFSLVFTNLNSGSEKYKKLGYVFTVVFVVLGVNANIQHQTKFVSEISKPSKSAFKYIKNNSDIEVGSLFYIYPVSDNKYAREIYELFAVGSMLPKSVFSVAHGLDIDDVDMPRNYAELLETVSSDPEILEKSYFYSYDNGVLKDITKESRNVLLTGNILISSEGDFGNDYEIATRNPVLVEISAVVNNENISSEMQSDDDMSGKIIDYLRFRNKYYENVSVETLSNARFHTSQYLVDDNTESAWRSNKIYWKESRTEEIIIDLHERSDIKGVAHLIFSTPLTPTDYSIYLSNNKSEWVLVKEVVDSPVVSQKSYIVDYFDAQPSRYVKFEIHDTFSGEAPGMTEIEVLTVENIDKVFLSKLGEIKNDKIMQYPELLNVEASLATLRGSVSQKMPLHGFNESYTYQFILNPDGYLTDTVSFSIPYVDEGYLKVGKIIISSLTISDIVNYGLVEQIKGVPYDI